MKEILYIPNSCFYRFNGNADSYEDFIYNSEYTYDFILSLILNRTYNPRNYLEIGIETNDILTADQFELVEVPD